MMQHCYIQSSSCISESRKSGEFVLVRFLDKAEAGLLIARATMFLTSAGYVTALAVGALLALIGGGGAILTLPIFVYLFKVPPWEATTYSLFVVGCTAGIGAMKQARAKMIDYGAAFRFVLPAVVAIHLVRALIVPRMPAEFSLPFLGLVTKDLLVMSVLALAMLLSAYSMLRKAPAIPNAAPELTPSEKLVKSASRGFAVGLFTGFVGAGGGFLFVPALSLIERLPLKRAVATSLFVVSINSLLGFAGDVVHGAAIDWRLLLEFSAMAALGMLGGTALTRSLAERQVRLAFGSTLVAMAVLIIALQVRS